MKVYIGIDWSKNNHEICFMNEHGGTVQQMRIKHTVAGFSELAKGCEALETDHYNSIIGLETAHNILVDFLWDRQYKQIYVLPPNAVKSARGRYRQSGAKDDPGDAWLIANMLRTDRQNYQPWVPDTSLTRQIRAHISLVYYLTRNITRSTNRLRSLLIRYYPAALNVFSSLDAPISLHFIQTFPTPQMAVQLTWDNFKLFAKQHHHTQPKVWPACYSRLMEPQPAADLAVVQAYAQQAQLLANLLLSWVESKKQVLKELETLLHKHPDYLIYNSLPGAGQFLQPALLSKLGDDRNRFPSPATLQAVAGTCPVTIRSGKYKRIVFRLACDHELRYFAQQWAKSSVNVSPWAYAYFSDARNRGFSKNHAYRCLANRWLSILWTLWQNHQPYDQNYHLSQRLARSLPRA